MKDFFRRVLAIYGRQSPGFHPPTAPSAEAELRTALATLANQWTAHATSLDTAADHAADPGIAETQRYRAGDWRKHAADLTAVLATGRVPGCHDNTTPTQGES